MSKIFFEGTKKVENENEIKKNEEKEFVFCKEIIYLWKLSLNIDWFTDWHAGKVNDRNSSPVLKNERKVILLRWHV